MGDGLTVFVKSSHCAGRCDAGFGQLIQSNILLKNDFFDSLRWQTINVCHLFCVCKVMNGIYAYIAYANTAWL